jgi:hypothetical protein
VPRRNPPSDDADDPRPLRLDVLAALTDFEPAASRPGGTLIHRDGRPYTAAEAGLVRSATAAEREAAQAMCAGPGEVRDPDARVIARLLRLAAGTPSAPALGLGLRAAFLPAGRVLERTRPERSAAFASVYRKLALAGLDGEAQQRAEALISALHLVPS